MKFFLNKVIHFKFTLMYFKSFIYKLKMLLFFKTAGSIILIYSTILKLNNDIWNLMIFITFETFFTNSISHLFSQILV
jgi:hypothetical protein